MILNLPHKKFGWRAGPALLADRAVVHLVGESLEHVVHGALAAAVVVVERRAVVVEVQQRRLLVSLGR